MYSLGSPFARRVRIILIEKELPFESDQREGLRPIEDIKSHNPALQIPVLYDGDRRIFDSSLLQRYLFATYPKAIGQGRPPLSPALVRAAQEWDDQMTLSVINSLAETILSFMLMGNVDAEKHPYVKRQRARVEECLDWLEARIGAEGFWPGTFSAMDINLLCALLYGEVRKVVSFRDGRWTKIAAWVQRTETRPSIVETTTDRKPVAA
jgi:glutathione S-transferase